MRYEEFTAYVKENILDWIPQGEDMSAEVKVSEKNNGVKEEYLSIEQAERTGGISIVPVLYLKPMYENYLMGMPMESVLNELANAYLGAAEPGFDFTKLQDYEVVKDSIIVALVNTEANKNLLKNLPHQSMNGLSVIYKIDVMHCPIWYDEDSNLNAAVNVNHNLMESYGITQEELHQIALENTERLYPPVMRGLHNYIQELMFDDMVEEMQPSKDDIYCLTNSETYLGAAAILYPEKMEEITRKLGDVYIIPSSIHEVLLVPKTLGTDAESLRQMLCEVNSESVDPKEYLADKIYEYEPNQKKLVIASGQQVPIKKHTGMKL